MLFENPTYSAALLAGLLSFFSPCILPLIPAYFSFITGLSLDELTQDKAENRNKVLLATLFYVAGVSSTFIMFGGAASFLGNFLAEYEWAFRYIGGTIIIVFGLHLLGIININAINFEKKIHVRKKPFHLMGIFVIGMAFGVGWTPCIGPIFSTILVLASKEGSVMEGISLLAVYSAGFSIPFLVMAFFISSVLDMVKTMTKYLGVLNKITGVLLISIGLLLIFNKFGFTVSF
ncbi:MAG: cytochrome c biogenesis protein CcdA [Pseudomonadota bacterium]